MNKHLLTGLLFSFFATVFGAVNAQTLDESAVKSYPKANITREHYLQLGTASAEQRKFLIDYNSLAFANDEQAKRFFAAFIDPNVVFEVYPTYRWAVVSLTPSDAEKASWNNVQWNEYFKAKLEKQRKEEGYFLDKAK
jgi:hypothetical protein